MSEQEPLPLASAEELDAYAAIFGLDREMVQLARKCPECEAAILAPDNSVWLDAKATGDGTWGVTKMGSLRMAATGALGPVGSRHTLHEHQPPGGLRG